MRPHVLMMSAIWVDAFIRAYADWNTVAAVSETAS